MEILRRLQSEVAGYDEKYGWENDPSPQIALHMAEELGEISRLILRETGYKKEDFTKKHMAEEIIDLLYLTIKLANKYELDLDAEWKASFERYEKKSSRKQK